MGRLGLEPRTLGLKVGEGRLCGARHGWGNRVLAGFATHTDATVSPRFVWSCYHPVTTAAGSAPGTTDRKGRTQPRPADHCSGRASPASACAHTQSLVMDALDAASKGCFTGINGEGARRNKPEVERPKTAATASDWHREPNRVNEPSAAATSATARPHRAGDRERKWRQRRQHHSVAEGGDGAGAPAESNVAGA